MRRKTHLAAFIVAVLGIATLAWHRTTAQAPPAPNKGGKPVAPLPVTSVVLGSSGVAYFERQGEVEGNSRVELAFPASDINDLLKSLVLRDSGNGKISVVSYDSQDPVDRTLRSFAINLSNNPTFGEILNQARGEKIEIALQQSSTAQPGNLTGVLVGMESRKENQAELEFLNLSCAEGMRSVLLDHVLRVRFLNPVLDAEFKRALEVLATVHDLRKKIVTLSFNGDGRRSVRVGYVVENPIWKTSYRLVVDRDGKPFLQGWALVENTSEEDWNDVGMVLISGRPISFQMRLYEPLYVPRPTVEPELFASLRPPAYNGALEAANQPMAAGQAGQQGALGALGVGGALGALGGGALGALGGAANFGGVGALGNVGYLGGMPAGNRYQFGGQFGNLGGVGPSALPNQRLTYEELQQRRQKLREAREAVGKAGSALADTSPDASLAAATSGESVGDYYRYVIEQKVTLPRQKSAMLPIVNHDVEAARVSIFNETVHARFPLLGLKFKNLAGKPLMQGPITVYAGDGYAGDARLPDLQPNEERLISYAVDQGTEVRTESRSSPGPLITIKIAKDVLHAGYKLRQTKTYVVKNRSAQDRLLVIEHPIRPGWKLVSPEKPSERSRDVYRFEVAVPAGHTVKQEVSEEETRIDLFSLSAADDQAPRFDLGLGMEVRTAAQPSTEELTRLAIVKGILHATYRVRETRTYLIQNRSGQDRTFAVDHFIGPEWKRVSVQGAGEQGPAVYRFDLAVPTGKSASQDVVEERSRVRANQNLKALTEPEIREFLASNVPSARVKAGLQKVQTFNTSLVETTKQIAELERQLKAIADEQVRLRANLEKVPADSAAYKRYLAKFDAQETQIEKLQEQVKLKEETRQQQLKEYDDAVLGLNVD